jgi:hypothetical protein
METKVYDYNTEAIRTKIVDAFDRGRAESTVADLVVRTGLPKVQVEEQIRSVSDEYGARLKVTESGEILYSFPGGMKSKYSGFGPSLKRFWKSFKAVSKKVLTFLFKAGSSNKSSSRRGDAGIGINLSMRLIELFVRIWFYSELFRDPNDRAYRREARKRERRPLHHAIFSFVFGDGDPNQGWETEERKIVLAFIQANKGIMSLEEFMILTGMGPAEAEKAIMAYLVEFEGNPEVTESGTMYFSFPEIMRKAESRSRVFALSLPLKRTEAFSKNPKKANLWLSAINGFNLVFGSYFLLSALTWGGDIFSVAASAARTLPGGSYLYYIAGLLFGPLFGYNAPDVAGFIAFILGLVPIGFAALFYLIPLIRNANLKKRNEKIKRENLRKLVYRKIWDSPDSFDPASMAVGEGAAIPTDPSREIESAAKEIAAWKTGDVSVLPSGNFGYQFKEISREKSDIEALRAKIDISRYDLGKTVFDSHAPEGEN